ncbi:MAG: hypothetical protein H6760_02445 [Candidatus Nomurabacteria bacterium]|nr:MAG: hypothetical protein H6760_02445 [Candidatus Nomurabacteria bacterium]
MEPSQMNTTPVASTTDQPAAAQAKAQPHVLVEVMEGVTLSALLILFSFLWAVGASVYMGAY